MFYLTTHSTHFIYGYMASDIWLRTILIVRKETRCRHIGYSYRIYRRRMAEYWAGKEGERFADACVMKQTHGVGKSSWFGEPSGSVIKLDLLSFRILAQVEVMVSQLCGISINARAHTARAIGEFLQQHIRISPVLNPIEHLWDEIKENSTK